MHRKSKVKHKKFLRMAVLFLPFTLHAKKHWYQLRMYFRKNTHKKFQKIRVFGWFSSEKSRGNRQLRIMKLPTKENNTEHLKSIQEKENIFGWTPEKRLIHYREEMISLKQFSNKKHSYEVLFIKMRFPICFFRSIYIISSLEKISRIQGLL